MFSIPRTSGGLLIALLLLCLGCSGRELGDPVGPPGGGDPSADDDRLTIHDLQNPRSSRHPRVGEQVVLRDVVVTAVDRFQEVDDGRRRTGTFWIQEREGGEYSGILVFNEAADGTPVVDIEGVRVGDVLTVRGLFGESFGRRQVTVQSVEKTGEATPVATRVAAADVATGGLLGPEFEGVLVRTGEVAVATSNAGFGRFAVTGGLLVGNELYRRPDFPPAQGLVFPELTGVMDYTFNERVLLPRSAADFSADAPSDGRPALTVRDIRDPASTSRPAPGAQVRLDGVVVTAVDRFREVEDERVRTGSFFVQDTDGGAWSGIYAFNPGGDQVDVTGLEPGDVVTLEGEYGVFFDFEQIEVRALTVTGRAEVPAPAVVPPADLATGSPLAPSWESVLVRVEDVEVVDGNVGFGQFMVTDDLRIGNNLYRVPSALRNVGQRFDRVDGVLVYTFNEHVLMPRASRDVREEGAPDPPTTDDRPPPTGTDSWSIPALRDPASGLRPAQGTVIALDGVVVTAVDRFQEPVSGVRVGSFYVQDPDVNSWAGLYVFNRNGDTVDVTNLRVGDVVSLEGEFDVFFGLDQLIVSRLEVQSEGVAPAARVVPPAEIRTGGPQAAALTGMLVRVEDVEVVEPSIERGQFVVSEGLRVGNHLYAVPAADRTAGQRYRSLSGILTLTFDERVLMPRGASDLRASDAPPSSTPGTGTEPPSTDPPGSSPTGSEPPPSSTGLAPIAIRTLKDPERESERPELDTPVRLEGVVVTAVDRYQQTGSMSRVNQLWVQDPEGGPWSGIFIFNRFADGAHRADVSGIAPGDIVTIEGTFTEAFGKLQVALGTIVVTGSGSVPEPAVVDAASLAPDGEGIARWEGTLVRVENVEIAAAQNNFGNTMTTAGMSIQNEIHEVQPPFAVGETFEAILGIVHLFNGPHLAPRSADDLIGRSGP